MFKSSLISLAYIGLTVLASCSFKDSPTGSFYVDPVKGDDSNTGSLEDPFRSIDKALLVVGERVKQGTLSDKIFLRAGCLQGHITPNILLARPERNSR